METSIQNRLCGFSTHGCVYWGCGCRGKKKKRNLLNYEFSDGWKTDRKSMGISSPLTPDFDDYGFSPRPFDDLVILISGNAPSWSHSNVPHAISAIIKRNTINFARLQIFLATFATNTFHHQRVLTDFRKIPPPPCTLSLTTCVFKHFA